MNNHKSATSIGGQNAYGGGKERVGTDYADEDGKETVADWDCEQDCPVKIIDQQSNGDASRFFKQFKKDEDQ